MYWRVLTVAFHTPQALRRRRPLLHMVLSLLLLHLLLMLLFCLVLPLLLEQEEERRQQVRESRVISRLTLLSCLLCHQHCVGLSILVIIITPTSICPLYIFLGCFFVFEACDRAWHVENPHGTFTKTRVGKYSMSNRQYKARHVGNVTIRKHVEMIVMLPE